MLSWPNLQNLDASTCADHFLSILEQSRQAVEACLKKGDFQWETFVEPMEMIDVQLSEAFFPLSHMNGVSSTDAWRSAYERCLGPLTEYSTQMSQNEDLYKAYQACLKLAKEQGLSYDKQRLLSESVRHFQRSGVGLPEDKRQRLQVIEQSLSQLSQQFQQNVMDSTDAFEHQVTDEACLSGLSESVIQSAQDKANDNKTEGYVFGIDAPTFDAVMKTADDERLREALYHGFVTRASEFTPSLNNDDLMVKILEKRQEKASLLGFKDYLSYSLEDKMAKIFKNVEDMYHALRDKAKKQASSEWKQLETFAGRSLNPWDVAYFSEKLKDHLFSIDDEKLKVYFPYQRVIDGLWWTLEQLYGIQFELKKEVGAWHDDAQVYELTKNGQSIGRLYCDWFARPKKRSGAWMDDCRSRFKTKDVHHLPVAMVVCNFSKEGLLTPNDVETVFHEIGHACHHLLTQKDYPSIAGINGVEWDAVELPSQLLENWCWQDDVLGKISAHHESGEPLPEDLKRALVDSKNFQSGLFLTRQVEFGWFDLMIHQQAPVSEKAIQSILDNIREEIIVTPISPKNRFQNGFMHIFSGGYAAGYYSYLWAEILSCDAFEYFEEKGVLKKESGEHFLNTILSQGSVKSMADLYHDFRGRPPKTEAFLRLNGIKE